MLPLAFVPQRWGYVCVANAANTTLGIKLHVPSRPHQKSESQHRMHTLIANAPKSPVASLTPMILGSFAKVPIVSGVISTTDGLEYL